jgi:hypothetical protein
MNETILTAHGKEITEIPRAAWEQQLGQAPEKIAERLTFMSDEHHRVRYHAVEQIARRGEPLSPSRIAEDLDLPPARVVAILDELEKNLFFLVRNGDGYVSWAFPVTVDPTPHRLVFSTGERLHGA